MASHTSSPGPVTPPGKVLTEGLRDVPAHPTLDQGGHHTRHLEGSSESDTPVNEAASFDTSPVSLSRKKGVNNQEPVSIAQDALAVPSYSTTSEQQGTTTNAELLGDQTIPSQEQDGSDKNEGPLDYCPPPFPPPAYTGPPPKSSLPKNLKPTQPWAKWKYGIESFEDAQLAQYLPPPFPPPHLAKLEAESRMLEEVRKVGAVVPIELPKRLPTKIEILGLACQGLMQLSEETLRLRREKAWLIDMLAHSNSDVDLLTKRMASTSFDRAL